MYLTIDPDVLFSNCEAELMSGSVAELGEGAGQITWRNSLQAAEDLFKGCNYDTLRDAGRIECYFGC